jgi:hypothetical protein
MKKKGRVLVFCEDSEFHIKKNVPPHVINFVKMRLEVHLFLGRFYLLFVHWALGWACTWSITWALKIHNLLI